MMTFVDVGRLDLAASIQTQRRITPRRTTQTEGVLSALSYRSRCRSVKKTATNFLGACRGLRGHINRGWYLAHLSARVGKFFRFLWDSKFVISWDRGVRFSVRWANER